MTYIKRAVEETIARVSKMFPVLLVTGPRQVGKNDLIAKNGRGTAKRRHRAQICTLDDPDVDTWQNTILPCFYRGIPHRY